MHDADGLDELRRTGAFVNVALGSSGESLENRLVVGACASDNNLQVRTRGFETGHHVEDARCAAATVAEQDQIDVRQLGKFLERCGSQIQIGLFVKKGTKADEP